MSSFIFGMSSNANNGSVAISASALGLAFAWLSGAANASCGKEGADAGAAVNSWVSSSWIA